MTKIEEELRKLKEERSRLIHKILELQRKNKRKYSDEVIALKENIRDLIIEHRDYKENANALREKLHEEIREIKEGMVVFKIFGKIIYFKIK